MKAWARSRDLAVEFRTVVEPSDEGLAVKAWGGGVKTTSDGAFHRYILDQSQKIYVGYDVRIQEGPDKTLLLVTIEPFSLEPEELPIKEPWSWKSFSLVREPRTQTLKLLESVALDLLVKQPTGQRVVDYITVGRDLDRLDRQRLRRGEPRPFNADEAEMELSSPTIAINGEKVWDTKGTIVVTGATIGLYLKDRGRFLFSLIPYEELGFRRAGSVWRSVLQFEWAGDKFEIESRRRIVPGAGTYHVYVHHDATFQPWGAMANQDFYVFATAQPAALLEHDPERR